jgi:hypothetical protein
MDDAQLRLDGNAAAGMFSEVFACDVTAARAACATCGAVVEMGRQHLYMYPLSPGAVLRCNRCEAVLMVLVHGRGHYRLSLHGLTWLEIPETV